MNLSSGGWPAVTGGTGRYSGASRHLSRTPKHITHQGSLTSNAGLAWPPLSPLPPQMTGAGTSQKQRGRRKGGKVICSPDRIHVGPTGLRNSFHKFLSKLNPTIQWSLSEASKGTSTRTPAPRASSWHRWEDMPESAAKLL